MKILFCGDREWKDISLIQAVMQVLQPTTVIEGEARGADVQSRQVAKSLGIYFKPYPAKWKKFGKAAGPIRNRQMYEEGMPDLVVAFHDTIAKSTGTKDMLEVAKVGRTPTVLVSHEDGNAVMRCHEVSEKIMRLLKHVGKVINMSKVRIV